MSLPFDLKRIRAYELEFGAGGQRLGERDAIIQRAFERGVLCLGAGPNTIRLSPPLIVSQEQAGVALDILEECIAQGGSVETMSQHKHLL